MRILIADDEELIIEFLERSLRIDKHVVDVARNGLEVMQKTEANTYDVIITDVIMPVKNGLEVCKELRENGVHTPIIMLTSRDTEAARISGLDAGADDYLTKPFSYKELSARVRAVARRPQNVAPTQLTVGPLSLDPVRKVISLDDSRIELRPKEYALLEYLMRNASKVVSKEELLKNVWLITANNASNRLEVCMHHIRGKVNTDDRQVLKTIRGYGYVIEA